MKRFVSALCLLTFCISLTAQAQEGYNPKAMEDLKAFMAKAEEGDGLFNQKKYAEAATALAASHEFYLRAQRREQEIGRYDLSIKPGQFPAARYYGYGLGPIANFTEKPDGSLAGAAAGMNTAMGKMWRDATILSGASQIPNTFFSDAPLEDFSEGLLNSLMSELYGPVSTFKLPVPDDEWRDVVLWSRRALLILEYALQKFPEWKASKPSWSFSNEKHRTGDEALADIKAKLAEAEPEYAKIVSDAKNAAPKGVKDWVGYKIEDIDKAISGVKQNGWLSWSLARDIFITKDYISGIRSAAAKMYADEAKTMPSDALKALEDKVAALKSAMDQGASRWKFPSGGGKNAAFESKAAATVKAKLPGATILKSGLDTGQWIITKNEYDLPTYRSMGVLVLAKIPGQKHPWLVFGYVRQTYSGGGTFAAGGTYNGISDIRMQAGG